MTTNKCNHKPNSKNNADSKLVCIVYLIFASFFSAYVYAMPTEVTLERDSSLIPTSTDFPISSWYKDIAMTPISPGGPLMLYLPTTMTSVFHEKIFIWNPGSNAFVDETDSWWTLDTTSPRNTYDADFIDIDGDGDADIVHSSPEGSRLLINTGNSFVDETAQRMPAIMLEPRVDIWDDVSGGDVDGDGDWDLVFANRTLDSHGNHTRPWGPNILLYNDGKGFFNQSAITYQLFGVDIDGDGPSVLLEGSSHAMKLADLNNDGRLDLIIGHNEYDEYPNVTPTTTVPNVELYQNVGDTDGDGFIDWLPWTAITNSNRPVNLAVFDFNHDGNLDIFTAGGSTERVHLGSGNGEFLSSIQAPTNVPAYDIAVGDINADGFLDVGLPQAQNGDAARALLLNDAGAGLFSSNPDVLNDDTEPAIHLSTAFADVDMDGDLDMVWGADATEGVGTQNQSRPTVMRNITGPSLVDTIPPRIDTPTMFLTTNGNAEAVFRVRIEDRLYDFDELSNVSITWNLERSDNSATQGTAALKRVADLTYQANFSCKDLQGNTPANVSITSFTGNVSATDVSGNQGSLQVVAADNLADGLDSDGLAFDLNILEPTSNWQSPVQPNDGSGRLFIRLKFTPSNFIPTLSEFDVNIGGQAADIISGERVGSEFWLGVTTPAGLNDVQSLEVNYRLCNSTANDTNNNAVVFGNPELSDSVLVIDTSGSMEDDRKMESAIGAASMFINTMRDGENMGVVEFSGNDSSGLGSALSVFGPSPVAGNRSNAIDLINSLQPDGSTSIGQGLILGADVVTAVEPADANDVRALVLISDGMENSPNFWAESPDGYIAPPENVPVVDTFNQQTNSDIKIHTLSLGPDADHQLMEDISFGRGDHREVNLDPVPQNAFLIDLLNNVGTAYAAAPPAISLAELTLPHRLANQYEHFHNSVSYQQRLWQGVHLSKGNPVSTPAANSSNNSAAQAANQPLPRNQVEIPIEPGLSYATVAINWEAPDEFDISIDSPSPMPAGTITSSQSATNKVFRIQQPVAGNWRLTISGPRLKELMITVSGISDERGFLRAIVGERRIATMMGVEVPASGQPKPGDKVPIALLLFGQQAVTNATVNAVAKSVAGQQQIFQLVDSGQAPDETANDGIYTGLLTETSQGGAFSIEAHATWNGADTVRRERIYPLTVTFAELDSDDDTVSNDDELRHGLDPTDPSDAGEDPDEDDLPTWKELLFDLDPFDPDTDNGGVDDGIEFCVGTDPLSADDDDAARKDSDGDGMPDLWEEKFDLNPNDPNDANADPDKDGFTNLQEFRYCTSPLDPDTDRDGVIDKDEVDRGTDPNDIHDRARPAVDDDNKKPIDKHSDYLFWVVCFVIGVLVGLCFCWLYKSKHNYN